jgi:hypothetical protein
VGSLVDNPLPQMIFLWDALDRDEKLALALLAETLPDDRSHATVEDIRRLIRRREYPLDLNKASIATALEKLFKSEMVLRSDATAPPGYAFRMDLWRLWIKRQHSVWQVMREAGLEIRKGIMSRKGPRLWITAGSVAALLVVISLAWSRLAPRRGSDLGLPPEVPTAHFALHATPDNAVIHLNGQRIGIGSFQDAIAAGRDHRLQLAVPGYADTEITVRLVAGQPMDTRIALRPLLGDLRIETTPPGADVAVDGRRVGKSPVVARSLAVAQSHTVSAALAGYGTTEGQFTVQQGQVTPAVLSLAVGKSDVLVITDPPGADVRVDGASRGPSPARLHGLTLGTHVVVAQRAGYLSAETTVVVTESTREIGIALAPQPPGELVVLGDVPASIYIDGTLVVENVQNSGPRRLAPGEHSVRVVLVSNETVDYKVEVRPGERATYDFSKNTVTRRAQGGTP